MYGGQPWQQAPQQQRNALRKAQLGAAGPEPQWHHVKTHHPVLLLLEYVMCRGS